jgi:hypothetical protein
VAFKTLQTQTEPTTLEAMSERLAEIGPIDVPSNSGKRRTKANRALLAEIGKLGGEWLEVSLWGRTCQRNLMLL